MITIRIIFLIYFIFYTIFCTKALNLPMIKNKHSLFYNEWINLLPIFYKNIFNSNIYKTGDFITTNKIDIVVCNHINRIDSLIISSIIKNNTTKNIYPVIQKEITKIPIIGSFHPACIVIDRNLELDKHIIINFLKNINNCVLIIYPEGTRLNENNFKKSQQYCDDNNLKKYDNLLYPKMKGLDLIINELNNSNKMGNLIDITIKVKKELKFKTGYFDFIKYNVGNLYYNVNTYKVNNNIFNNYELFKKWFIMIWDKKEDYLNNYNKCIYKNSNYTIKTSTFILNIIFISLLIFQSKILNGSLLSNKKNIIIE